MSAPAPTPTSRRPLRLWPGVVIVAVQLAARFVVPWFVPEAMPVGAMIAMAGGPALAVWWLFFSRAAWIERLGAVALMVAAVAATPLVLHPSVAEGAMGFLFYLYVVPGLCAAFVAWAVATRGLSVATRRATMVLAILGACGAWALVRTGGFTGEGDSDFAWRWSPTPEERLLAAAAAPPAAPATPATAPEAPPPAEPTPTEAATAAAESPAPAEAPVVAGVVAVAEPVAPEPPRWPGFRGPSRDGAARAVRLATDWQASPPVELWRRPIGPGWSSFAVGGDRVYTQEQRGDEEVVAAYDLATGDAVWMHGDAARFWESNAGPGPRATPTLHGGRVYTLGATGILNALDAADGTVVWSRDAAADSGAALPDWGFAGSPLVVDDLVLVATSGALAAYDRATGAPRWVGPAHGTGYSSPLLATVDGVEQVLQLDGEGLIGVAPADGTVLWRHEWSGYPIVQPALTDEGDILVAVTASSGTRRVAVARASALGATPELAGGGWTTEERWTSTGLKPYFNDFVVHGGHAFGFDGAILACIDLETGARRWKGGRYGHGQLVLLPGQDLLLVLSEKGEMALVAASPEGFSELARVPAIAGKTWNHPVVVDDLVLVRNGEEMVAFRLPRAGSSRDASRR